MRNRPVVSRQDAEQYATDALGEYAPQHDLDAVLDALWHPHRGWDALTDPEVFWRAVSEHALPQPAPDCCTTHDGPHLHGCMLAPAHRGACRLARPFRLRPEGGRRYPGESR